MDDAIVVGGGIVGASAAYHLARLGAQVTLIDQAQAGQATAAGAGIIAPGTGFSQPAAFFPLAFRAAAYYEELLAHLAEDGESRTGYETVGLLQIATTEPEAARLPILLRLLDERRAAGVHNLGEVHLLDSQQTRKLFPALGTVQGAIHVSGAARLDGRLMRAALRGAAQLRGTRIVVSERAATLVREGTRVSRVDVDGQTFAARWVILATGAWSGQCAQALDIELPIYPQRGQILHLQGPQEAGQWPIVMNFRSYYLLTFPGGRVVAGATREHQAGFAVQATAGGVDEVLNETLRMAPDLGSATLHEVRVGLRPATPDGLPVLGRIAQIDNLFLATGHGASGLQVGPYSGALVASLVAGHRPVLDLSPFSAERFHPA
jgi:D-amino-acid dehydrogenase